MDSTSNEIDLELDDAFNLLDNPKKNYLSLKEVRVAIKAFGVKISEDKLNNAFKDGMRCVTQERS